jgi:TonB family protein
MRVLSALSALLMLCTIAQGKDPEAYLKSAPMPFYPSLARQARIEGKVELHFIVNEQGDTTEIEGTTGHIMLKQAALDDVARWKFAWPSPCACRITREAVFVYRISGQTESPDRPNATVKWFGKTGAIRVEIGADAPELQFEESF